MTMEALRSTVTRHPVWVIAGWVVVALVVGLGAPDLTRLAAEGQAHLLHDTAESFLAARLIEKAWPEEASESQIVVALHRATKLTEADRGFARRLSDRFSNPEGRPDDVLRVLGPASNPAIADRLISKDGTLELLIVPLSTSFVAPSSELAVAWLKRQAAAPGLAIPAGLEVIWTGDAVIGHDYMRNVQISLDRAAIATVFLLLGVLMVVYRSIWLTLVPLATIGISVVIARGLLAWAATLGWEMSPLVELFLIVLLFGSGTDFCLFVSWRYGEHWDPNDPGEAMRTTLRLGSPAILTSAGTVFVGLMLMGTNHFKLFSATGPSVALGLLVTLFATLTLTPALLVLLARKHPRAFAGLTGPSTGFWERFAKRVLARPTLSWAGALLAMAPLAILGTRTSFTQDTLLELPQDTPSSNGLRLVAEKFGAGSSAPLTVVIASEENLRESSGLALIDELSRLLSRQRNVDEVRSATQPLGSPAPLNAARLSARLKAVNDGFGQIEAGAGQLRDRLDEGLAKIQAAKWLGEKTGFRLFGQPAGGGDPSKAARDSVASSLMQATSSLVNPNPLSALIPGEKPKEEPAKPAAPDAMTDQLAQAVAGAGQISDGIHLASLEIQAILNDPVGRRALDRLLITPQTVRDHPELKESFDAYITQDGRYARIDVVQNERIFSGKAMDQVLSLRRKLRDRLEEDDPATEAKDVPPVKILVGGSNAESVDIRTLTRADQFQSWFVIPIGVFLVLLVALRDIVACVNLVGTMLLTYLFALGATHLLFITILGAEGLDWKVPYFLFVLLVAVGVDYNVFLMTRLREETGTLGLRAGIGKAIAQTGGLITSAAAITAVSFASFLFSPLGSLRQLGFALVVGITVDALLVRPLLVPCGQWLINRRIEKKKLAKPPTPAAAEPVASMAR
ncbi:MMPL family transporter [Tundrisphaera sp. TA3]|uniref:MMPL family transporter n=1 Tax=Tundrisphaera sp. TA3 TaxID=3435775 RepID=UPI003EBF6705